MDNIKSVIHSSQNISLARQGSLFPKDPSSQNQEKEDDQMRKYLRDLDFNILHCDVMDIIRQILMKVDFQQLSEL